MQSFELGRGPCAPRTCKAVLPIVPLLVFVVVSAAHAQTGGNARNADRPSRGTVPAQAKPAPRKPAASSTGDALMELGNRLLEMDKAQQDSARRKAQMEITVAATGSNGCASALNIDGAIVSVNDPIAANGSAQAALDAARAHLRALDAQGPCSQYGDADACELDRKSWSAMTRALECHAAAEARGDASKATKAPEKSPQQAAKDGAEDMLGMIDTPGAKPPAGRGGTPSASGPDAARRAQRSSKLAPFPTPRCKFVSDPEYRHEALRYVCHAGFVYECRDRAASAGRDAWNLVTTQKGCGNVRDIVAVEAEFLDLVDTSKSLNEQD